jgi:hypothetical protein
MNTNQEQYDAGNLCEALPDPPDNFDEFNAFPERFRERVASQFQAGIDHEYELIRDRVQQEITTGRARYAETVKLRQAREARRGRQRAA